MHVYDARGEQLCRNYGKCRNFFHQPGAKTGKRNALNREELRSCPVVEELMMGDIPDVTKSTFNKKCPVGSSKVAAVVDKGSDYHWYRQDRDGMWSHKDGSNKVKRFDALKKPIFNPELASRNYRWQGSDLNYDDFCGYYCVPRNRPIVLGRGTSDPSENKAVENAEMRQRQMRRARRLRKTRRAGAPKGTRRAPRGTRRQRGRGYDVRLDMLPPGVQRIDYPWWVYPAPSASGVIHGAAPPPGFGFPPK